MIKLLNHDEYDVYTLPHKYQQMFQDGKRMRVWDMASVVYYYAPPETTPNKIYRKAFVKSSSGRLLPNTNHIRLIQSNLDWIYFM